ncbi:acyl-CoA N-acyltransferase [Rhexocercosporidium sp. MPI-PUGE-AT-0058]|nr:acyl-CoA N-acyltransferase [Rhexocercosporidium sp. MPI-PUGE-AT-0058]
MSSLAAGTTFQDTHVLSDSRPDIPPPLNRFGLRPLILADVPTLALHSAEAYWEGPVNRFIAPHAAKYRSDFVRNFHQGIRKRLFNPRSLSLVVYEASDPTFPVGYAQFTRLGDDEGAKAYLGKHSLWDRIWFFVFAWFFSVYDKVENSMWPDRSRDVEATKTFFASAAGDEKTYWELHPERSNRWHVQSVVISPAYQGKGLGRMLVTEVVNRAQHERVIMGLSASPAGEFLYRKLGFELLGEFTIRIGGEEGGGIMIRYPEGQDQ